LIAISTYGFFFGCGLLDSSLTTLPSALAGADSNSDITTTSPYSRHRNHPKAHKEQEDSEQEQQSEEQYNIPPLSTSRLSRPFVPTILEEEDEDSSSPSSHQQASSISMATVLNAPKGRQRQKHPVLSLSSSAAAARRDYNYSR
jgi:hypothetical protein